MVRFCFHRFLKLRSPKSGFHNFIGIWIPAISGKMEDKHAWMCVVHQVHVYIHSHMYNIEIEGKVGRDRSTSYNTLLKDPVITDGAVNTIPEEFLRKWVEVQYFLSHCDFEYRGPHLSLSTVLSLALQNNRIILTLYLI